MITWIQKQLKHTPSSGFTLMETLVAVFIFSTSIVVLTTVSSRGITATNTAQGEITAQYLAQAGIEYVRMIRDSNLIIIQAGSVTPWFDGLNVCVPVGSLTGCRLEPMGGTFVLNPCALSDCGVMYRNPLGILGYDSTPPNPEVPFRRIITIQPIPFGDPHELIVTSRVTWTTRGVERNVTLQESIFQR